MGQNQEKSYSQSSLYIAVISREEEHKHETMLGFVHDFTKKKLCWFLCACAASRAEFSNNPQDEKEDVYDVEVEVEDCKDVILWTQWQLLVAQEHLSVESQPLEGKKLNSRSSSQEKCFLFFL